MIELPEQVTVVMYKDKRGRLHQTQASAIDSDNYFERLRLVEDLKDIIFDHKSLSQTIGFSNDPTEFSENLMDFLVSEINELLPLVQAYVRVKNIV